MASIRKSPNSPNWQAVLTLPDGRRTNRSTECADRVKAKKIADLMQEQINEANRGFITDTTSRKLANKVADIIGADRCEIPTVARFIEDAWLKPLKNPSTLERYAHTAEVFLSVIGKEKAARPISLISYRDIEQFIDTRQAARLAPKTLSVDLKTLNTCFNLALRLGHISENPVIKANALRKITHGVKSSERDVFTTAELEALAIAASSRQNKDWLTVLLLGIYTAARLSDCANLRFSSLDLKANTLKYRAKKRGAEMTVPLHPTLHQHLATLPRFSPDAPLCPSLAGRKPGGAHGLSRGFLALMKEAGIDSRVSNGQGSRKFGKLSFHSLRHTANSMMANGGIDQETRMGVTGHTHKETNDNYTKLGLSKLATAVAVLPHLPIQSRAA